MYDLGIEWAVIKAVSDFADGSKEKTKVWQPFASAMAASVVYNMFQYPVVLKDWRHYNAEGSYILLYRLHTFSSTQTGRDSATRREFLVFKKTES